MSIAEGSTGVFISDTPVKSGRPRANGAYSGVNT